jgi:hypothetical protein
MLRRLGKRAEEGSSINVQVAVILGIIVLIGVIAFFGRSHIINYLRNLSGYKYNENDTVINQTRLDNLVKDGYKCDPVGRLEGQDPKEKGVSMWNGTNFLPKDSDVVMKITSSQFMSLVISNFFSDTLVGEVRNGVLNTVADASLNSDITGYFSYDELVALNGASVVDFNSVYYLCRLTVKVPESKKNDLSVPNNVEFKTYTLNDNNKRVEVCAIDFGDTRGTYRIIREFFGIGTEEVGGHTLTVEKWSDWRLQKFDSSKRDFMDVSFSSIVSGDANLDKLREDLIARCVPVKSTASAKTLAEYYAYFTKDKNKALADPEFPFSDLSLNDNYAFGSDGSVILYRSSGPFKDGGDILLGVKPNFNGASINFLLTCDKSWIDKYLKNSFPEGYVSGTDTATVRIPIGKNGFLSVWAQRALTFSFTDSSSFKVSSFNGVQLKVYASQESDCTISIESITK